MARFNQQLNNLGEDFFENVLQTITPEPVDGVVIRMLHTTQPHEVDILVKRLLDLPAGISVGQIAID
jgi:hypothetical protein